MAERRAAGAWRRYLLAVYLLPICLLPLWAATVNPRAGVAQERTASAQQEDAQPGVQPEAKSTEARDDIARFSDRVQAALASAGGTKAYWGVLVTDADRGEVLYSVNAGRYFTPASNAKLFTTAMALATLGPEFRIRTTVESAGERDSAG
jgi:D-alanyl-D-alanine carboxypeptidase/D-alanyl-D-alanine-endopeptidase (penicillin-binding protein 4)